jgi:hypothetical protein
VEPRERIRAGTGRIPDCDRNDRLVTNPATDSSLTLRMTAASFNGNVRGVGGEAANTPHHFFMKVLCHSDRREESHEGAGSPGMVIL